jgi:hypothetical protein
MVMLGIGSDRSTTIGEKIKISGILAELGITEGLSPSDFEAAGLVLNYKLRIAPLETTFVDNTEVYLNGNSTKDTFIDMSVRGMHIDENLTAYLEYYFLDQTCDQVPVDITDFNQDILYWSCPCGINDVDNMPNIKL